MAGMSVTDEEERASMAGRDADASDGVEPRAGRVRGRWLGSWRRPRWWQELLFIGGSYFLYTLTRNSVPAHEMLAMHRASDLLRVEQLLHIDVERSANAAFSHVTWLAVGANYYYATLHFGMTIGVLLWLYLRHPHRYRGVRTALYVTNLVALAGFWLFPLAPPRMLGGYVDTIVKFHTWGSWGSGDVADMSNQFAAMPSLHIGWALWCGITLWRLAPRRSVRILGLCYPLVTLAVIVGTANHFVLDAAGGAAALAIGYGVQRLVSGRPAYGALADDHLRRAAAA
jgi:PAP2 superfamily